MKAARETKWYSRPSCSFMRGARVVCETLKRNSTIESRSRFVKVVLPAPEGDEIINGRGVILGNVLYLFAKTFDLAFHLDDQLGHFGVGRLGADRIYFTADFLKKKVESTTDLLRICQQRRKL